MKPVDQARRHRDPTAPANGADAHRHYWNFAVLAFLLAVFLFVFLVNWPR
jgi:hypothetical protein